ncbi:MAG: polyprenyl synthetase family protein [Anaerolineae bacterium]|nr:polyprenyl synthetase family protein [Anaerolineae bacterium]
MNPDPFSFPEAAIVTYLVHLYRQITPSITDALEPALRWVCDCVGAHSDFLHLPLLTCLGAGGDVAPVIPVVSAWHLLYCAAHLLDDVADGAPLPWEPAWTVNVAVTLIFLAQTSLTALRQHQIEAERILALMETFNAASIRIALGQASDLACDTQSPTLDDYWRMAGAKSGECFVLACRAGAMMGNGELNVIENYAAFGYHLGLLVQLGDDLQALWQPRHRGDLATIARTLPLVYARSVSSPEMLTRLYVLVCRAGNESAALTELQSVLAEMGALHYLALQASRQRYLARESLYAATWPGAVRDQLSMLLDKMALTGALEQ